jgi:hypothetical protein
MMTKKRGISSQTRNNWLIDTVLFLGALVAAITGIYFLFLPVGGYQGGRNPMYGVKILFERETWDDLHTWFGIVMIVAAAVHIVVHWNWIVNMAKRIYKEAVGRERHLNQRSRFNVGINTLIGLSFLVTAASGVVLLFTPGGKMATSAPVFIFSRTTWDLTHTWAGIVMIFTAIFHFVIHWGWVTKVTRKVLASAVRGISGQKMVRSTANPRVR